MILSKTTLIATFITIAMLAGCTSSENEVTEGNISKYSKVPNYTIGLDISEHTVNLNLDSAWDNGVRFIFVKRSGMKNKKIDSAFKKYWNPAKEKGFIRGAYHYWYNDMSGKVQANAFLKDLNSNEDFFVFLDLENESHEKTIYNVDKELLEWIKIVEDSLNRDVLIYTGEGSFSDFREISEVKNETLKVLTSMGLWVEASNGEFPDLKKILVQNGHTWKEWKFWQYEITKNISKWANNVDINVFNGNIDTLKCFLSNNNRKECIK